MQPISSSIYPFSSADPQLTGGTFRSSDLTRLSASTDTHTDLSVITAGGDRITLSAESFLRASYAELNYQSTDPQYRLDIHATDSQVQFGNSIEVTVQGQLDQQEQADLQLLVGKLEKVVKQFLAGDPEGALNKALQIGDLGTVASFQLHVQQSEQIAFTQEQQISADEAQALPKQNAGTQDQAKPPSLAHQIVDTIHDTKFDTKKLLQYLPHLLKHLFHKLHATVSDEDVAQLFSEVETGLQASPIAPEPASS